MRAPLAFSLSILTLLGLACTQTSSPTMGAPLPVPTGLSSISLNQAIDLYWTDNAYNANPSRFESYYIYSTSYDLDRGVCGTSWTTEGSTIAPEFLVSALNNGEPRCYAVTSLTTDGAESARSAARQDTPRPDARNVLVYAYPEDSAQSGFRFWHDFNANGKVDTGELGRIESGNLSTIDFVVDRHGADSSLWVIPVYANTTMQQYGAGPVADLTSVDFAPANGYTADSAKVQPGYAYVFQMLEPGTTFPHYGAIRLTHVGRKYLIFDWSFQTDPGNPELQVRR